MGLKVLPKHIEDCKKIVTFQNNIDFVDAEKSNFWTYHFGGGNFISCPNQLLNRSVRPALHVNSKPHDPYRTTYTVHFLLNKHQWYTLKLTHFLQSISDPIDHSNLSNLRHGHLYIWTELLYLA